MGFKPSNILFRVVATIRGREGYAEASTLARSRHQQKKMASGKGEIYQFNRLSTQTSEKNLQPPCSYLSFKKKKGGTMLK